MEYKLNLTQFDPSKAKLVGPELMFEDKTTGKVYVTSKAYMDKLFNLEGYRNLSVVKILEEFADKTISDIGSLHDCELYIDDITDSFILTSPSSVRWVENLLMYFEDNDFRIIQTNRHDSFYAWDELLVAVPNGNYFAIYIDMCDEKAHVLALDYKESDKKLLGVSNEGSYAFSDPNTMNNLLVLMESPIDISVNFTPTQSLSMYEYVTLLKRLGYVKSTKKRGYYKTDSAEEIEPYDGYIDALLDDTNCMSWLKQRITASPIKFSEACELISTHLGYHDNTIWSFQDIYLDNAFEKSDMFALNN